MGIGARGGRIRAFRCEEAEAQVERRRVALAVMFAQPQDIARALREARRAGRAGAGFYDPARHAALIRLWKARARPVRAGGCSSCRDDGTIEGAG
ncbi:hypothetical protein V5F53_01905 [Xanthobacter sp. V4C-4]|uniref:hypothetical protein n=1 Tax=Xanthobacter cornucopiae TaxID=3119924 RepID=UPI00372A45BE